MDDKHLYLLWANGDPIVSEHMVMMYATNAMLNGWWDQVTVIIWGASQITATENEGVRLKMKLARQAGVEFSACLSCALNLGTKESLEADGVEVIRWGEKLSGLMQAGEKVLSV